MFLWSQKVQRVVIGLSLAVSCASSMAMPAYTGGLARYNFSGYTLGFAGGAAGMSLSPTITIVDTTGTSTAAGISKKNQFLFGGGIDFGYGLAYPSGFFWGGDLGLSITSTPGGMGVTTTESGSSVTTALTINNAGNFFGTLDFLAGYMLTDDTLLYARLGLGLNNAKIAITSVDATSVTSTNKTHILTALRAGLGLKYAFAQNGNLTLSYVYMASGSFQQTATVVNTSTEYVGTVKESPSWNGIMLGLEIQCSSISC